VPGNEDAGFAKALVGVDGEWRGIQVTAMSKEKQVIDFDPTQGRSALPGIDTDTPASRRHTTGVDDSSGVQREPTPHE
jgi:hypothetical protein